MDNRQLFFQEYLLKDEHILWQGQPDASKNFAPIDLFLVPFSFLWGGFAIFWEYNAIFTIPHDTPGIIDLIFPLFGIPFVLAGLYLIFGRFIFKRWKKGRTHYAVTNKRILAFSRVFGQQFQEADIKAISGINKRVGSDGTGTLTFGGSQSMFAVFTALNFWANTGMDIFPFFAPQLGLYDIKDANEVYRTIMEIKTKEA